MVVAAATESKVFDLTVRTPKDSSERHQGKKHEDLLRLAVDLGAEQQKYANEQGRSSRSQQHQLLLELHRRTTSLCVWQMSQKSIWRHRMKMAICRSSSRACFMTSLCFESYILWEPICNTEIKVERMLFTVPALLAARILRRSSSVR